MTRFERKPALIALGVALAAGLTLMAATGQFRGNDLASLSREQLERRIGSGHADASVWLAYGEKLYAAAEFGKAAEAYQRTLDVAAAGGGSGGGKEFDADKARFEQALALAQCGKPEEFFTYFNALASTYPKVAVDLLERRELTAMHGDVRWEPSAAAARAQSVD